MQDVQLKYRNTNIHCYLYTCGSYSTDIEFSFKRWVPDAAETMFGGEYEELDEFQVPIEEVSQFWLMLLADGWRMTKEPAVLTSAV